MRDYQIQCDPAPSGLPISYEGADFDSNSGGVESTAIPVKISICGGFKQ